MNSTVQVLNELIHKVVYIPLRAGYACSVAESAIRSKRLRQGCTDASTFCVFAPDKTYYKPKDNGAGRFTILANGKDPCIFFDRPASVDSKARIRFCLEALRFVGNEPTPKVLQKSVQI